MGERTCKIARCDRKYFSRDLCSYHYGVAYRRGDLRQPTLPFDRHSLQHVDLSTKTAHCSICGQAARIRIRTNGRPECQGKRLQSGTRRRRDDLRSLVTPREQNLIAKYGVNQEKYDAMLAEQDDSCAICQQKFDYHLKVDHCHETGRVRGLLCHRCNVGLGWFQDDPERIVRAANYLRP